MVWTEEIAEPYYIGYINDIKKMPSRKIFAREPKSKIYAAKHYFKDGIQLLQCRYKSMESSQKDI